MRGSMCWPRAPKSATLRACPVFLACQVGGLSMHVMVGVGPWQTQGPRDIGNVTITRVSKAKGGALTRTGAHRDKAAERTMSQAVLDFNVEPVRRSLAREAAVVRTLCDVRSSLCTTGGCLIRCLHQGYADNLGA